MSGRKFCGASCAEDEQWSGPISGKLVTFIHLMFYHVMTTECEDRPHTATTPHTPLLLTWSGAVH